MKFTITASLFLLLITHPWTVFMIFYTPPDYCKLHQYNKEGPWPVIDSHRGNYTFNVSVQRFTFLCKTSGALKLLSYRYFSTPRLNLPYHYAIENNHYSKMCTDSCDSRMVKKFIIKIHDRIHISRSWRSHPIVFPYLERNCEKVYWTNWTETTSYCNSQLQEISYTRSCVDCYGNEVDKSLKPLCKGLWVKGRTCQQQLEIISSQSNGTLGNKTSGGKNEISGACLYIGIGVAGGAVVITVICVSLVDLLRKKWASRKKILHSRGSTTAPEINATMHHNTISNGIAQTQQTKTSSSEQSRNRREDENDYICPNELIGFPNTYTTPCSTNQDSAYFGSSSMGIYELPMTSFSQYDEQDSNVYEN